MAKILVLGGAGFIGSILSQDLHKRGDEVTVMDTLFYETKPRQFHPIRFVHGDIRNRHDLEEEIKNTDAVVNLAAMSNDPTSNLDPALTKEINHHANELVAELCARHGRRIVFSSSCAVYGFAEETFHEDSKTNPLSLYARTKVLSEKVYRDSGADVICLRFATAYGYTDKIRFDLVVNNMTGDAHFNNKIVIHGGDQWRPLVHVRDISRSIQAALDIKTPKYRLFNIGSNEQNYKIEDLARHIVSFFPNAKFEQEKENPDPRSYRVDFTRAEKELGFKAKHTVADAVKEFQEVFSTGKIASMDLDEYFRINFLKKYNVIKSIRK